MKLLASIGFAALTALPLPAWAISLAPHRAVYDLKLDAARDPGEGDGTMRGRMVYEFTGSACEGYTVNFRFVIETDDGNGGTTLTDLRTSNHEAADDTDFQFLSQTYTNQVLTEDVKGSANRAPDQVAVDLSKPESRKVVLDKSATFPTAHLKRIIEAAEAGQTVLSVDVFDGSDGGDRAYRTTTIIGKERSGAPDANEAPIGQMRRWPVSVSYFDSSQSGDLTPDYTVSFDLWENGVSSKMRLDYGDFVLAGDIGQYQPLPAGDCPQ